MHRLKLIHLVLPFLLLQLSTKELQAECTLSKEIFQSKYLRNKDAEELREIRSRISQSSIVRSHFNQKKFLKAFKRPLLSSGQFLFSERNGILWRTEQPFVSIFSMSKKGIFQQIENQAATKIPMGKQPAILKINSVFKAAFRGDISSLNSEFEVYSYLTDSHWNLGLRAQDPEISQLINEIILCGMSQVQSILINEGNGDSSEIHFETHKNTEQKLSSEEIRYFAIED